MKVPVLSSLILMLGLCTSLHAIERPKGLDAEQPNEGPSAREAEAVQEEPDGRQEGDRAEELKQDEGGPEQAPPGAWLGVLSEPIDEALAVHLDLATGVVLNFVAQDSPAAAAGLQRHDVIVKVDGRAIANQDELREEIQAHDPGDEVTITAINRGQEVERTVKLGERPAIVPAEPGLGGLPGNFGLGGLEERLPDLQERMRGFERFLPEGGEQFQKQLGDHMKRLERQLRELEKAGGGQLKMDFDLLDNFEKLPKPGNDGGAFNLEFKSSSSFKFFDNEGSVEMKMRDGSKEVVVRDQDGGILFEGPWDTAQDKASAPENIRTRIERMNAGNRLNFRLENLPELEMEMPEVEKPELE